jgi:hypothetical protein
MNTAALLAFASALFAFALAFSVLWNGRRTAAPVFFAIGMAVLGLESVFNALAQNASSIVDASATGEIYRWERWRLITISFLPAGWLAYGLTYGRGDHREFLRRWKYALLAFLILPPALAAFSFPDLVLPLDPQKPPYQDVYLNRSGAALNIIFLIGIVLVLMNLERTFRAAVGTMRWRIKFMILGLGVLFVVRAYTSTETLLFHATNLPLQTVDSGALLAACFLIFRSLRREGHFEIDVYPSHLVLQNSLTVLLAGIYLVVIGLFAKVIVWLKPAAHNGEFPITAFLVLAALVGLTVLLLSDRVKLHISRFVSRHFQRPMFDYRTVWRKFTEATASCVSQNELCQAAVKSTTDIFQTLSVTIWLVDDKKENLIFAASNFLSEAKARDLVPQKNEIAEALTRLQLNHEPLDIDDAKEDWVEALRRCHPQEFHKGGHRIATPMIVGGETCSNASATRSPPGCLTCGWRKNSCRPRNWKRSRPCPPFSCTT